MNRKILFVIIIALLVSFVNVIARDYKPIDCPGKYCYFDSKDGKAMLTNNPSPAHYILIRPKGRFEEVQEETYIQKGDAVILKNGDFNIKKSGLGGYDEFSYAFSSNAPNLTSGEYIFSTVFKDTYSGAKTQRYTFTDIIDLIAPAIENIELYENSVLSNDNVIEKDSNIIINVKALDEDGISDTGVIGVNISVSGEILPMTYKGNNIYSIDLNLNVGQYTVKFYAYDNLTNVNDSETYEFSVNDTKPRPIAPVLWYLPSETEEQFINVIGYTNESNVTVYIGTSEYDEEPMYAKEEYVTYDSKLKGVFDVIAQTGSELTVSKAAYDTIDMGDFVWFDAANLTYFMRYEVVNKRIGWSNSYKITLGPSLTKNIVDKELFVYDEPYPEGWFNISAELIPETKNYILAYAIDYLGNSGYETIAGPVYFHIKPPVLYDVPLVVGQDNVDVVGYAKPLNNIVVYCSNNIETRQYSVQSDVEGDFSVMIDLFEGENFVYALIVDDSDNPLTDKSNEILVYYDKEGPEIEITQPGLATNKQNVEVRANLKDYSEIVNVELLINDTLPYTYSKTFYEKDVSFFKVSSPLSKNGTYLITITAEDRFGNINSEEREFILDTSMPDPAVFNLDGAIINSSSPILNFTFNQQVQIHDLEGVDYISINTTDNMAFLFVTEGLDDGAYKVTITASALKGGNAGTYVFGFTVDTTKPTVTIDQIVHHPIWPETVNISGSCEDVNFDKLFISSDGHLEEPVDCVGGVYKRVNFDLEEGRLHTVMVRATDLAGNSNSITQVVDTGIPEINVTNVVGEGLIIEDGQYKINNDEITITGSYMEEEFGDIEVLVNGEPADCEINTYATSDSGGIFEINVTLLGDLNEEFVNNITVVVKDKSGFKDEQSIIVIKDFMGPTIIGFEPETMVVSNRTPTLKIKTSEYADLCKIEYPTGGGYNKTQNFATEDNRNFVVSLTTTLENKSEPQDLSIICNDSFSNVKTTIVPIIVDQLDPSIEEFYLFYSEEMALWQEDLNYKKYLIKELNTAEPVGAMVGLRVKPNEAARCRYYGSRNGVFANYEYLFEEMSSSKSEVLENNGEYTFNIICEDKAGRLSEVKMIDVVVNSTHPVTAPLIKLIKPTTIIVTTRSPIFEGSIISLAPDAPITESKLKINGTTYDLELEEGKFSITIEPLPKDGEYSFAISAKNSKGNSTILEDLIIVDTTGPGACVRIGEVVYCFPVGSGGVGGGGISTTTAHTESDFDNDGLPDVFEFKYFNCIICAEPDDDSDSDGLTNLEEYEQGTEPVEAGSLGGPGGYITVNSS